MDRKEYLSTVWKSYPAMPLSTSSTKVNSGRLLTIEKQGSGCSLVLLRNGHRLTFNFENIPQIYDYLIPGDLIALVQKDNEPLEIILLAPQLKHLPSRTIDHEILNQFSVYLSEIRNYFAAQGFIEVKTPSLVSCPGTEPALDVFATEFKLGSRREKLFLPTSPELHLKKVLALGIDKIFEIATCYRNGEVTERHQPEFLMLEWYRAFDNLDSIKQDFIFLIDHLCKQLGKVGPSKVLSFSVAELFEKYCHFELTPQTTKEELQQLAEKIGVDVRSAESIDDFFFLIFMEKIESQLPKDELIFVEKYPPYQAALARLTNDGWGDRFEGYWQGLELCNAFHELNDPKIQRDRSMEDLQKKKESGKEIVNLDEEFFVCLEAGMPPSGGIALGVERLFMCLFGITQISNLRVFPR